CETDKPVIVFDRGVETDCAVTFIHPIGGFAWGIDSAEFLIDNLSEGDKVVALRILPGVDVLEQRWAAAEKLFDEAGIDVVDHFTEGDPATIRRSSPTSWPSPMCRVSGWTPVTAPSRRSKRSRTPARTTR